MPDIALHYTYIIIPFSPGKINCFFREGKRKAPVRNFGQALILYAEDLFAGGYVFLFVYEALIVERLERTELLLDGDRGVGLLIGRGSGAAGIAVGVVLIGWGLGDVAVLFEGADDQP